MPSHGDKNQRLTELFDAFVEAGRRVVEEKLVTEDELHIGSRFLQELGNQRFLVGLIDMAFATAASEAHAGLAGVQKANLEGPLYLPGAPLRADGVLYEQVPSAVARFVTLRGRVFDAATGIGIPGAELDFWQTDEFGVYDLTGYHFRGIVLSDDDGAYTVKTILPEPYTMHEDDLISDLFGMMGRHAFRSAHIHLKVRVAGREVLTTQFFDPASDYLDDDVVTGAVRPDVMMDVQEVSTGRSGRREFEATFDLPVTLNSPADTVLSSTTEHA